MNPSRAKLLAATCCAGALALAGCGGDSDMDASKPAPVAGPVAFPKPEGKTLVQLLEEHGPSGPIIVPAVAELEPGKPNRFGFGLFDRAKKQIADAEVALYVAPAGGGPARGPYVTSYKSLKTKPSFRSRTVASDPDSAGTIYTSKLPFPRKGTYEVLGLVRLDDRLVAAAPAGVLRVRKGGVPDVGDRAPRIETPTKADVGGALAEIDTRVPPSSMHDDDFKDVVGKKPVVLVFSTPQLCKSRVCGPVVDMAEQVKSESGGKASFIHMEIYNENDLAKGYRPQVNAFRLPSEPWVFTIDRRGRIAARIEGAFGVDELEQAVAKATKG